jgi:hypothetical protein
VTGFLDGSVPSAFVRNSPAFEPLPASCCHPERQIVGSGQDAPTFRNAVNREMRARERDGTRWSGERGSSSRVETADQSDHWASPCTRRTRTPTIHSGRKINHIGTIHRGRRSQRWTHGQSGLRPHRERFAVECLYLRGECAFEGSRSGVGHACLVPTVTAARRSHADCAILASRTNVSHKQDSAVSILGTGCWDVVPIAMGTWKHLGDHVWKSQGGELFLLNGKFPGLS